MKKLLLSFSLILISCLSFSQTISQYFDDSLANNSLIVKRDTASGNIWQVGKPQKMIFDSAATLPNVIITDTLNYIPSNNTSRFTFSIDPSWGNYGILAIRWKQKLDYEKKHSGGIVEYSSDTGKSWHNVFNSPYVYNYYGFDTLNKDTLITGDYAFSGTDSVWRDIWLCFDKSFIAFSGKTLTFRFTSVSDTSNTSKEGWMIDNMSVHTTWHHTVVKGPGDGDYLHVYPTKTNGIVHIEAQKLQQYHIIKSMQLINADGKVVQTYGTSPTKFYIDISQFPDGVYYLKVNTNFKSQTFPVILIR